MSACENCGLPDIHRGQGDGIGSCDCPRCMCCGAAPGECDCARDVDDAEEIEELGDDYLCNDIGCPTRRARAEARRTSTAEKPAPVTVDVVIRMDPMTFKVDDFDALAKQFAGWIVNNVTKMTEPKGADLFVCVLVHRGEQRAGCTYREGRFLKDDKPASDDPEEVSDGHV